MRKLASPDEDFAPEHRGGSAGIHRQLDGSGGSPNIRLGAFVSADMKSGYVFGMHMNFDSSPLSEVDNQKALAAGDIALAPPFRRHARVWLNDGYRHALVTVQRRCNVRA